MKYTEPEMEILAFETEDVIITSGFDLDEDGLQQKAAGVSLLGLYDN